MQFDTQRQQLQAEYEQLTQQLQDPSIYTTSEGQQVAKRHAELQQLLELFDQVAQTEQQLEQTRELLQSDDPDMRQLAHSEYEQLQSQLESANQDLETALIPKDPRDDKPAVIEIRAGAGGDEASLFAGDLYRMYYKYAESQGWKQELLSHSPSDVGGYKEISFKITATGSYGRLKFESGVHRVQRVPETESSGRIHTSTVSVAVLPEAEEHDVDIDDNDLRIDTFRSSGPGGQSVNTTDSAVRILHEPSGITVTCQDEKSQHKNREKALSILRSRLLAAKIEEEERARAAERKGQIGSGDRSEKIRTYNFPQDRLTDHRIKYTTQGLDSILDGQLEELLQALHSADTESRKNEVNS